jgi:hypothetical protein
MMKSLNTPMAQLVAGLLIGAAVFAAFAIGDSLGAALVSGGIVVAFVLTVHLGRRRIESLEVMSGLGDERSRHLYVHSTALAGSVMAFVLPTWWLVTVAQGKPDETLSTLCAVFGLTWIAAAIMLPRRS